MGKVAQVYRAQKKLSSNIKHRIAATNTAAVRLAQTLRKENDKLSMQILHQGRQILAVALLAIGVGVANGQTAASEEAKEAAVAAAKEKARKGSASVADLQKLIEQINSQREKMIADHDALAKQLKDATDEQRKVIMDKLRDQKKAFEEAQSALHKQIRDEQRRQRQNAAPGRR